MPTFHTNPCIVSIFPPFGTQALLHRAWWKENTECPFKARDSAMRHNMEEKNTKQNIMKSHSLDAAAFEKKQTHIRLLRQPPHWSDSNLILNFA